MAFPNILNQRFSKLIVIEQPSKSRHVKARCDCGVERHVDKYDLVKGKIQTCRSKGCSLLIKDITGQKFGSLTAVRIDTSIDARQNHWIVNCDCGSELSVPVSDLIRGHTKSCGCDKGKLIAAKNTKDADTVILRSLYNSYRGNARKRNVDWKLTYLEFLTYLSKNCYYCSSEPRLTTRTYRKYRNHLIKYNGIDRVDNSLGYNIDNCVSCCFICNRAKNTMSVNEFLDWCDMVGKNVARLRKTY